MLGFLQHLGRGRRAYNHPPFVGYFSVQTDQHHRDVTSPQGIAEKLRACENQGCLLSDNIGDVLCTLDSLFAITYVSRSVLKLFGYAPEEIRNVPVERLFSASSSRTLAAALKKVAKTDAKDEHPRILELEGATKEGAAVWVEMRITKIHGEGAEPWVILAVMRDITHQRLAEIEKDRLEKRLLKTQRVETVGTLASGIAHDFNNILTTINGYCELLLKDIGQDRRLRDDVEQIQNAAARGEALVRQLLAFARRQEAHLVPLNINSIVQEMLKMLDRLIGEDIVILTELAHDLWTVRADAVRIEQVIMNLAVNARDAMPEGGRITIRTENVMLSEQDTEAIPDARPGAFVRMMVTDSGRGLDEKSRSRIFEPFFTTKREGAGLGLATVKAIALQHKGWVTAANAEGGGAEFSLYLPAVSETGRDHHQSRPKTSRGCCGNHERILVVEDDDAIRDVTTRTLTREGYEVSAAADADQAIALFEQKSGAFDLLFSDVVLPGRSGVELAIELQKRKPDLRILLASGYANDKVQWPEIKRRGYRFLRKPFLIEELLQNIQLTLQST